MYKEKLSINGIFPFDFDKMCLDIIINDHKVCILLLTINHVF